MTNFDLSAIELFAGAGGFAIGLERAGITPNLLVESDRDALETVRLNRPTWRIDRRLATAPVELMPTDLLVADLPSESTSEASTSHSGGIPAALFNQVIEAAGVTNAKAIVVQGVRALATARLRPALSEFRSALDRMGYVTDWRITSAAHFGVPQLRPRFLLIALKSDSFTRFDWPTGDLHLPSLGQTLLPLMASQGWDGATAWSESAIGLAPTIIGGSRKHGGADLGPTRTKQAWLVLGVDPRGVADGPPTADTPTTVLPRLTNPMIAAIQAFPPDWQFVGSRTSVFRQIARATPPPVSEAIGNAIASALLRVAQ